jgi:hypothetical protein
MAALADLEKTLDEVFVKKAPALPENGKKWIVEYLPWINVILGVLALWAVYTLWNWARWTSEWAEYANSLSAMYGGSAAVSTSRWTVGVWLSLAVLAAQAILYILAFPALKARKKSGWNLLFYAALVNVAYGLVVLFTDYGGFGSFIGSLIGTAIGLYFLFQVRSHYLGVRATAHAKTTKKA